MIFCFDSILLFNFIPNTAPEIVVLINWVTSACTPDHNNTTKNVSNASNCEFIIDIMIIIMRYQSGKTNIFKSANVKLK